MSGKVRPLLEDLLPRFYRVITESPAPFIKDLFTSMPLSLAAGGLAAGLVSPQPQGPHAAILELRHLRPLWPRIAAPGVHRGGTGGRANSFATVAQP
jgi:hypothetical protein